MKEAQALAQSTPTAIAADLAGREPRVFPEPMQSYAFADGSVLAAVETEPVQYFGYDPADLVSVKAFEDWITANCPEYPRTALAELSPVLIALEAEAEQG